jgi:Domain of unknown function (DUF4373)
MARPKKIGLDYFPVDVQFDRKIEAIEHLYGNDGLVWIIKFWQQAYQTEYGEVILNKLFGELLANNCRITPELQDKIILSAIELGLLIKIGENMYTSNGIKKRMAAVSSDRKKAIERKIKNKSKDKEKESKTSPDCSPNNSYYDKPLKGTKLPKEKNIIPPSLEMIKKYCDERKNNINAQEFIDHYEARDWKPKGYTQRMKDWQATIRTWEKNHFQGNKNGNGQTGLQQNRGENYRNAGKPGYNENGRALGAAAKPGEFDEGIITLEGVPDHR